MPATAQMLAPPLIEEVSSHVKSLAKSYYATDKKRSGTQFVCDRLLAQWGRNPGFWDRWWDGARLTPALRKVLFYNLPRHKQV